MSVDIEIEPEKGLCGVSFGDPSNKVLELFGQPERVSEQDAISMLRYSKIGLNFRFTNNRLDFVSISSINRDTILCDEKIFSGSRTNQVRDWRETIDFIESMKWSYEVLSSSFGDRIRVSGKSICFCFEGQSLDTIQLECELQNA